MDPSPGRHLERESEIADAVRSFRRVAVLGMKTEAQAGQPSFDVPHYLHTQGIEVIPVPVYYPETTEILGKPVFRRVADVPGPIDCVDVFRRPQDLAPHVADLIAARPRVVWFQSGIRNDAVADALVAAGIDVVQDRCLYVDHRRFAR